MLGARQNTHRRLRARPSRPALARQEGSEPLPAEEAGGQRYGSTRRRYPRSDAFWHSGKALNRNFDDLLVGQTVGVDARRASF